MYKVVNGYKSGWTGRGRVYIGRSNFKPGLRRSPLANPFAIGKDGDRQEVIRKYRIWLYERIVAGDNTVLCELMGIRAVADRNGGDVELVCYCSPQKCHGDIIASCLEWIDRDIDAFRDLVSRK